MFPHDRFRQIDKALGRYYKSLQIRNYFNGNGNGRFYQYIITEQLDDPSLPINEELGIGCDPHDCSYTDFDPQFPIPMEISINDKKQQEAFIFFVLQHCYRYNIPPTKRECKQHALSSTAFDVVPRTEVNISNERTNDFPVHTTPTIDVSTIKYDFNDDKTLVVISWNAPKSELIGNTEYRVIFNSNYFGGQQTFKKALMSLSSSLLPIKFTVITVCIGDDNKRYESVPSQSIFIPHPKPKPSATHHKIERISKCIFRPKYPARAHLNIFTSKETTKNLLNAVEEHFEDDLIAYYYTDISTAFQINDEFVNEYRIKINGKIENVVIINYDLHKKGDPTEVLYGIIVPNDDYKIKMDKWQWKLDCFMTADQINKKYAVKTDELPPSSRILAPYKKEMESATKYEIKYDELLKETDWFNIKQIKSLKRNYKIPKVTLSLTRDMFIAECLESWNRDKGLEGLIPVVVNKNGKHWIEWIKIIHIQSQSMAFGICLKYEDDVNKWVVQSMCLDRGDIYNKHRLVGVTDKNELQKYKKFLENFNTSLTEIKFIDQALEDNKINLLKQQIKSQQDSIESKKRHNAELKKQNQAYGGGGNVNGYNQYHHHYNSVIDDDDDESKQNQKNNTRERPLLRCTHPNYNAADDVFSDGEVSGDDQKVFDGDDEKFLLKYMNSKLEQQLKEKRSKYQRLETQYNIVRRELAQYMRYVNSTICD